MAGASKRFVLLAVAGRIGPGGIGAVLACGAGGLYWLATTTEQWQPVPPVVAPGQWQSYDINWTAPMFTAEGALNSPARVTFWFNGVLVQDNFALLGETKFIGTPSYHAHGPAPIMLQAHPDLSAPVSFRNVWLRELPPCIPPQTR